MRFKRPKKLTDRKIRPKQIKAHILPLLKAGYEAFMAKDLQTLANILETILTAIPGEPNALLLAAMMASEKGKGKLPDGSTIDGFALADEWIERAMGSTHLPWPMAWNFKATMYFRRCDWQKGVDAADECLRLKPNTFEAYINKANCLTAMGRYDEAHATLDQAEACKPDQPSAKFNRSFPTLACGDWTTGFQLYDERWMMPEWIRDHGRPWHATHPRWYGSKVGTLLLHWEQGLGDTLMMLRYIPWVLCYADSVVLEVQAKLARFCDRRIDDPRVVVVATGDPLPVFDAYCPLLSLPSVHGTTPENVPQMRLT